MTIDELFKEMKKEFKNVNIRLDNVEKRLDNVEMEVQKMKVNLEKVNDKLDNVTNSNLAQILFNQTKNQKEINNKMTYNELEHKKFDCRITELELQKKLV